MSIEMSIPNNVKISDFMSRFFAEYCMSIRGSLFQDPDQYLSDKTFDTLKEKIIQFCEPPLTISSWSYQKCRTTRTTYDWKSFYRCLGIFLRETVLRYGKSISQGQFWQNINDSVNISLFNKNTLEEIVKLDDGYGNTLFYNAFKEFRDQDIKYPRPENGQSNDYVGHMLKIAVLPFNLNPFNYEKCQEEYLRNNLGNFIFNANLASLNRHPATKELLTRKINDFFVYYEDLRGLPLDVQKERLENFYGISRRNIWIYKWLAQASQTHIPTPPNPTPELQIKNIQRVQQQIFTNSIKQSRILLRLFGTQDIRYQTQQSIDVLGVLFKDVFNDANHNHRLNDEMNLSLEDGSVITIRNKHFVNITNNDVDKLLMSRSVNVSINRVNYEHQDNPWFTGRNWHILNYTGAEITRLAVDANHHCYIVIPADKKISHICTNFSNQNRITPTPLQGISFFNVYQINSTILQNADTLHVVLSNGEDFYVEVEDPTYLRLHQKTDRNTVIGPTKFIFQQKSHKIGIGKIEFSIKTLDDIENANYDDIINSLKAAYIADNSLDDNAISVQIQENSDNGIEYLCLTNNTTSILEFEEKFLLNTQLKLPSITIFPRNVEIWVAKKSTDPNDYFCSFIDGEVDNLSGSWTNWHSENCRIYDNGDDWFMSGAKTVFANRAIYLHAPYLTTRASGVQNWDNSRNIPMYNGIFGNLIPDNALYYFEWFENNARCRAMSMQASSNVNYGKTIRDAYRDLDINGAKVLFGWEYKQTYFADRYQQAADYTGPRTPRTEGFYTWNEEDRRDILCNILSKGMYLRTKLNDLIVQYAELFERDSSLENQCKACATTAEMLKLINNHLAKLDPNYNSIRIQNVINQVYETIRECIEDKIIPQTVIDGNPITQELFTQASSEEYVRERVLYYICKRNCNWIEDSDYMNAVYVDVFDLEPNEDLSTKKREVFTRPLTKEFLKTVFDNI